MAALLRIAIALDRNHDGGVAGVGLGPSAGSAESPLTIRLHPGVPGSALGLELFSAADRSGLLEECLGVPVRFESAGEPASAD